jgi:site-specific DNA recombinase
MSRTQAAIYARVSSEKQADTNTIESQVQALRDRVQSDGIEIEKDMEFIDDGYSGATLIRPGLERLRDDVAAGMVDRLYIHSPDRLARKYAWQVLLADELRQSGVEIVFLNRQLGYTPEDELLLQVQGVISEYERAKIIERSRRGRRHAARKGSVSVMVNAPYGYRYVKKNEGGGEARYEILTDQARVVQQIFEWVGIQRIGLWEVCRRLQSAGELTRSGNTRWDRSTVWGVLKNPAYKGSAAFGKTRSEAWRSGLRPRKNGPAQPRRPRSRAAVDQQDWISIPVPPIIDTELFDSVQEQLQENQRRAQTRRKGSGFLLQGLIRCAHCGYALCGTRNGHNSYYRCTGTDRYRFREDRVCNSTSVRVEQLDSAVWQEVRSVLDHPERLAEEYRRRMEAPSEKMGQLSATQTQLNRLQHGIDRLIDSYAGGLVNKEEFEPRITAMRERIKKLEALAEDLADQERVHNDLRLIVGQLEEFSRRVRAGLDEASWEVKREVIRALVKHIEVGAKDVNVVFRIDPRPFDSSPERGLVHFCLGRQRSTHCRDCVKSLNPTHCRSCEKICVATSVIAMI